jgi:hypothetical protein
MVLIKAAVPGPPIKKLEEVAMELQMVLTMVAERED